MSFEDLLKDTLATLWAHKRRTLLTMFGIAWGIISITVMVAAGEGLGQGIQKNQETFGKDVMVIFSGRTSMQAGGLRSGRAVRWMEDDYLQGRGRFAGLQIRHARARKYLAGAQLVQQRQHTDGGIASAVHRDS
jgi:hypothetical protein